MVKMETVGPSNINRKGIVRLSITDMGTWYEVSCEVCHKIVVSGEVAVLQADISTTLARVAPEHLHPGM